MNAICPYCKKEFEKKAGYINRANKLGVPIYCNRACSSNARTTTIEEKKAVKAAYDKQKLLKPEIKAKRKAYNETPKGRDAQKRRRKTRMPKHIEYSRQPEYKKKKHEYDLLRQQKVTLGEFAECGMLLNKIYELIDNREVKQLNGLINKSQIRKRRWLRTQKLSLTL